jgi:hypothetical protein
MSAQPEIGGRAPLPIDVEAGKSYWCAPAIMPNQLKHPVALCCLIH